MQLKPVFYLIGLGNEGLDKLTLGAYRTIAAAKIIYAFCPDHPAIHDLKREGFPVTVLADLPSDKEKEAANRLKELILVLPREADRISGQICLVLPGNPIIEGKEVSSLISALKNQYEVNMDFLPAEKSLERLTGIMAELRSESGCPWDKEQNFESLKKYLIEETYEVIDAIDSQDMNNFCEELGDLLLQIIFHSQIAEEEKLFTISDVIKGISEKLVRRHPHVFGRAVAESSRQVLINWDVIKRGEKAAGNHGFGEGIEYFNFPKGLPALLMAEKSQKEAAKTGFDWENYRGPLAKIYEELAELEKAIETKVGIEEELGDLLFSIVNLSRWLEVNSEDALRRGTKKFQLRFNKVAQKILHENSNIEKMSPGKIDMHWNLVKKEEKSGEEGLN